MNTRPNPAPRRLQRAAPPGHQPAPGLQSFFAPCPRGLEHLLVDELSALGASDIGAVPGGALFRGDWRVCYRANLHSRIATRVLWRVGQGRYASEHDIYALASAYVWPEWFEVKRTLRVYLTATRSPLRSLEFATLRVKDAVCDRFRAVTGQRPSVDTAAPDVRIHVFLNQDSATFYLDTSGEPLYKRGYKQAPVAAPLKENLAAGILKLAGWQPGEPLLDPMCGSGTFLLEAAQISLNIAPGLGRSFGFEKLRIFQPALWRALRDEAQAACLPLRQLPIFGSDRHRQQVINARTTLDAAGLLEAVQFELVDVLERQAPAPEGVLIANPPYGVRLGEKEELAAFYAKLGNALKQHFSGWRCYFISGDEQFPALIKLKASKRTPLFNGALECRLYEYRMVAGSNRRRGDQVAGGEAASSA